MKSASPLINSSLSREFDLQLVPTVVQQLTRYFNPHISYTGSVVRPVAVAELLVFYYSSIVTISLSCTFSEILALIPPPQFLEVTYGHDHHANLARKLVSRRLILVCYDTIRHAILTCARKPT